VSLQAFFASCPRGLESLLAEELGPLGAKKPEPVSGGVAFEGDMRACYRANLESRLATRVLMRLARSPYRGEEDVYEAALAVKWPEWFSETQSIRVDVNAIRSPLKSLEFATLRIKDAVCDRFRADRGRRPDVDTRSPEIRIQAFLDKTTVTLYLDTSGEVLNRRGYRRDAGEAPLKENLAAGIVGLTGWRSGEPLIDPMCGSGTLVIEAAMIALAIPPGHARAFGFERLAGFDLTPQQIAKLRGPVGLSIGSRTPPEIAVAILAEMTAVRHGVSEPSWAAKPAPRFDPSACEVKTP